MNVNNEIMVSVCVVTYNQENYIAECLESLVTQKTDFKFEIIIGEDCSTDSTRSIVEKYVEKYPNIIVPLFYEKNLGPTENIKQVYKIARGKYIAHMDGDDLAMPYKLQAQFNILEKNKDCIICSHDMIAINNLSQQNNFQPWRFPEGRYNVVDLLRQLPFFAHSSKMFRNKFYSDYWEKVINHNYTLDIEIHYQQALEGDIYHIGKNLGCYRSGVGISMGNKKVNSYMIIGMENVYKNALVSFPSIEVNDIIKKAYAYNLLQYAYYYAIYDNDLLMFNKYLKKSMDIKFLGLKHILFIFASKFPRIFFKFFSYRNDRKYK